MALLKAKCQKVLAEKSGDTTFVCVSLKWTMAVINLICAIIFKTFTRNNNQQSERPNSRKIFSEM